MNKHAIVQAIIAAIEVELATCQAAARAASKAATDPDSKAENKYDTRNLEASYIARGQAIRLRELTDALDGYQALLGGTDLVRTKVQTGTLLLLEGEEDQYYYLGPAMGGLEVTVDRHSIIVLTPTAPLGQRLMGQQPGFTFRLTPNQPLSQVELLTVE